VVSSAVLSNLRRAPGLAAAASSVHFLSAAIDVLHASVVVVASVTHLAAAVLSSLH